MNHDLLDAIKVPASISWSDAAARINETAQGVLLAVDADGRLVRTVTDGDVRRALIDGVAPAAALADLPGRAPLSLPESATVAQAQALMREYGISHVPVLDAKGRPLDLVTARDLSQRIWLSSPHLGEEESAFVEDAFRTNWIAPLARTWTASSASWPSTWAWAMPPR